MEQSAPGLPTDLRSPSLQSVLNTPVDRIRCSLVGELRVPARDSSLSVQPPPDTGAGRRPRLYFRGLLKLHTRYGLQSCSLPYVSFITKARPSRFPDSVVKVVKWRGTSSAMTTSERAVCVAVCIGVAGQAGTCTLNGILTLRVTAVGERGRSLGYQRPVRLMVRNVSTQELGPIYPAYKDPTPQCDRSLVGS